MQGIDEGQVLLLVYLLVSYSGVNQSSTVYWKPGSVAGTGHIAINKMSRDFPGGPEVKTLNSQCRGLKFDPWSGTQILYAAAKSLCGTLKIPHAKDPTQPKEKKMQSHSLPSWISQSRVEDEKLGVWVGERITVPHRLVLFGLQRALRTFKIWLQTLGPFPHGNCQPALCKGFLTALTRVSCHVTSLTKLVLLIL